MDPHRKEIDDEERKEKEKIPKGEMVEDSE